MKAIDVHVHPMTPEAFAAQGGRNVEVMSSYFGRDVKPLSFDALADQYRELDMMAVLLGTDYSTATGLLPMSNEDVARATREHSDVFIGFAGVDPWKGRLALDDVRRAHELGLKGLKFNPGRQAFFANEPRFYPLWEAASRLGMICLFHSGTMGAGAGARGGLGYKLKYTAPIPYLDDIAADFPDLTIISAHPGWPWQEEQLAMARHKGNVFIDLSGWLPRYFPQSLVQYANSILQDKCLFGSDWPFVQPARWLEDFAELPLKPEVRTKILLENARRLFGLA